MQRFYQPASPTEYSRLDRALKRMQKSSDGFQFADAMMKSKDANVRFFGCLTFTVKINCDWWVRRLPYDYSQTESRHLYRKSLEPQAASELLVRLLSWLIQLVSMNESAFVVKKLCSSLVAAFLQSDGQWHRCIRHVISCFYANRALEPSAVENESAVTIDALIDDVDVRYLVVTQWFATLLYEEVGTMSTDAVALYVWPRY